MNFLVILSLFFYAFNLVYIPSVVFYLPFYLKNINFGKYTNSVLPLTVFTSLLIAVFIHSSISYLVALKTFFLCLLYPISFNFGNYLSNRFDKLTTNQINKFFIYSNVFLIFIFLNKTFFYEPSAVSRTYMGASLLFSLIIIEKNLNSRSLIILFPFFITSIFALLINNSLTLYLFLLGGFITFFVIRIYNSATIFSKRISKKIIKIFIYMIILILFLSLFITQFELISERRLNNLYSLWKSLRTLDTSLLLSLGGGRFLAAYSAYKDFFSQPFDFSKFFLDLPVINQNNEYLGSLVKYSGLEDYFFTNKRAGAYVPFLLFNLRVLALPYLLHIVFVFVKLVNFFKEIIDIRYKIFFAFFFFYWFYSVFVTSPTSFCLPWILYGFIYSRILLRSNNKKI